MIEKWFGKNIAGYVVIGLMLVATIGLCGSLVYSSIHICGCNPEICY